MVDVVFFNKTTYKFQNPKDIKIKKIFQKDDYETMKQNFKSFDLGFACKDRIFWFKISLST